MFQHNHSQNNQKAVLGSAILAKAVCRRSNGSYEMIVVFSLATRQEFYFTFKVKSPRSPRRSWKFVGYSARTNHYYNDFGSYVSHRAQLHGAEVLSTRMPQKRRLASLMTKTAHDSIFSDWAPVATSDLMLASQDRMANKARNGRRGKAAWVWSR